MGEYTVEQVNRQAQKELRSGAHSQSYGMLKAYAALLERQANAAGEYVANIDRYGGVIWTKGTPPHGTKLFTHPPARASAVPDGWGAERQHFAPHPSRWRVTSPSGITMDEPDKPPRPGLWRGGTRSLAR